MGTITRIGGRAERQQGQRTQDGRGTVSGHAGTLRVHWIGSGKLADDLEDKYILGSPLQRLLIRNAYTLEGLSRHEFLEASKLIASGEENSDTCSLCKGHVPNPPRAIGGTNMCADHCRASLTYKI